MKTADIATKNHVSTEHIILICNELGITCKDENSDISEKDLFLVEKKIEVMKAKRTKKALEILEKRNEKTQKAKTGKKIKLKRRVQVSKGLIKEKPADLLDKETKGTIKKRKKTIEKRSEAGKGKLVKGKEQIQKDNRKERDKRRYKDNKGISNGKFSNRKIYKKCKNSVL